MLRKNESCVAGFDLLNEPLPDWFSRYNELVLPLYRDIAKAIRQVDTRHMLILEGVHWATDFVIFDELESENFDSNYMLQFHKYWSTPDIESIQKYVDYSSKLNVPLYMGEGGENNLDWYTGFFSMLTGHEISYSFWSYKKMSCDNSPVTFNIPEGWDKLIEYIDNRSELSKEDACAIFDEFIKEIRQSVIKYDVINAIRRLAPVSIPAEYFDESHSVFPREKGAEIRMTEAMTILFENGKTGVPDYKRYGGEIQPETEQIIVKLNREEYVKYRFLVKEEGEYRIQIYCRAEEKETTAGLILDDAHIADLNIDQKMSYANAQQYVFMNKGWHSIGICSKGIIYIRKINII
ncbi:MAG: glycoside hydrolase [Eubacterium sp.]|nr:glycoside hydrolase [Eubacterium sp.]